MWSDVRGAPLNFIWICLAAGTNIELENLRFVAFVVKIIQEVVGGLLAAHFLSHKAGFDSGPGWPCSGPFLDKAEAFAVKLLPAFDTKTGLPYGTVNLGANAVPRGETSVTCVAGIGTFILEFGTLSRLTGDPRYEMVAIRALRSLWESRSSLGLLGNHIDTSNRRWVAGEATIGSGVDSYFEYLVKGSILFRMSELGQAFREYKAAIERHLRHGDWHFIVDRNTGSVVQPVFQGLDAFWPGILALGGDIDDALRHTTAYHELWKKYGFIPEMYNVFDGKVLKKHSSYLLRPEFIESVYYMYRATKDPHLIKMGVDVLTSIEKSTRTPCGYATVHDVHTHTLENRMESFFLAETLKYLYLLFDDDNFIHQQPDSHPPSDSIRSTSGSACYPGAGGYIFNTEAHPIDPGALTCCDAHYLDNLDRIHGMEHPSAESSRFATKSAERLPDEVKLLHDLDPLTDIVQKTIDSEFAKFFSSIASTSGSTPLSFQEPLNQVLSLDADATAPLTCGAKQEVEYQILDVWNHVRQVNDSYVASSKRDRRSNNDFKPKANDDPTLLTCAYPPFHQRFIHSGQLPPPAG